MTIFIKLDIQDRRRENGNQLVFIFYFSRSKYIYQKLSYKKDKMIAQKNPVLFTVKFL